jgi:hypothetical protein
VKSWKPRVSAGLKAPESPSIQASNRVGGETSERT